MGYPNPVGGFDTALEATEVSSGGPPAMLAAAALGGRPSSSVARSALRTEVTVVILIESGDGRLFDADYSVVYRLREERLRPRVASFLQIFIFRVSGYFDKLRTGSCCTCTELH